MLIKVFLILKELSCLRDKNPQTHRHSPPYVGKATPQTHHLSLTNCFVQTLGRHMEHQSHSEPCIKIVLIVKESSLLEAENPQTHIRSLP